MPIYYYKFNTSEEIDAPPKKRKRNCLQSNTLIIKALDIFEAQSKVEAHIQNRKNFNHNLSSYELILTHIS